MARTENQKQKLLLLRDYLEQNTDAEHPASMAAILEHLSRSGVQAERKSVYSDLQALQDYGMDILYSGGKNGGYWLASRQFELPVLTLLVDAVQSSRFLTEKKSLELIRKLETLTSRHEAVSLRRQVVVSGRVKTMNESIYYNVDRIHAAIACNSQISFRYFDWGVDNKRHDRGKTRTASPCFLCWDNENYYLVAYTREHGITHFRVDKMSGISQTGEARVVNDETKKLDPADYSKHVFNMYRGSRTTVKLRCDNALAGVILDRFGRDVMLVPDGDSHFLFTCEICLSPVFYGWLAGFGARIKIVYPTAAAEEFQALCKQALAQYE